MDVLNTYGGGVDYDVGLIVLNSVVVLLFAGCCVAAWRTKDRGWAVLFAIIVMLNGVAVAINVAGPEQVPVRHEVKLRQGGVIDARKYNVIEQRGKIYVIEERKQSAK